MRIAGINPDLILKGEISNPPFLRGAGGINPDSTTEGINLLFMQSNGGLVNAASFQGKDCILSGPAGGIVGAVETSLQAGLKKIITFDMGGTSTDVAHFCGEYERVLETEVAGVRVRSAIFMNFHRIRINPDGIAGTQNLAPLIPDPDN